MTNRYTLNFSDISHADFARVGGKCASLGEMTQAGVAAVPVASRADVRFGAGWSRPSILA